MQAGAADTIHTFTIAADSRLLGYDRFAFIVINMEGSGDEETGRLSTFS